MLFWLRRRRKHAGKSGSVLVDASDCRLFSSSKQTAQGIVIKYDYFTPLYPHFHVMKTLTLKMMKTDAPIAIKIIAPILLFLLCGLTKPVRAQINSQVILNPITKRYFADPNIKEKNVPYLYATIDPWGGDQVLYVRAVGSEVWAGEGSILKIKPRA